MRISIWLCAALLCCAPSLPAALVVPIAATIQQTQKLHAAGDFAGAQRLLEAQLQKVKVPTDRQKLQIEMADVHYWWAEARKKAYDFEGAIAHYQAAYAIDKTLRRRDAAIDLSNIGAAYNSLSRYEEALRYYQMALPIEHEIKDRRGEAANLNNVGSAYDSLSRYEEALRYYELALPIFREVKDRQGEAATLNNIGGAYHNLSRYEEALRYYQMALPIRREVKDHQGEAVTLDNIGGAYHNLSRYEEALRYYQMALPIRREVKDRQGEAVTLNNIGGAYHNLSRYEEALRYYQMALPIRREVKDRQGEATTLNNIGGAYHNLSRYEEALRYYQMALPIRREVKDRQGEATTLNNIGEAYDSLSRYEEALRYYQMALPIRREVKDRAGEATTLSNLMSLAKVQQQRLLAVLYGKQSVNLYQAVRRDIRGLDKESQQAFLKGNQDTYETLAALLIELGRLPEAEQVTRMWREEEVFEFVRRDPTQAGLTQDVALSDQEKQWLQTANDLAADALRIGARYDELKAKGRQRTTAEETEFAALQKQQEALNGRWEIFRREVAQAFAKANQKPAVDVAESTAWQNTLAELEKDGAGRAAVLTTVAAPDTFYVIVATAHGHQQFSYPIKAADLNALVARLRQALTNPRLDPRPLAQQLYRIVFCDGKLQAALDGAGIDRALWFLSGTLRYVPFDALHDGQQYLIERPRQNIVLTLSSRDHLGAPADGDALGVGTSQGQTIEVKDAIGTVVERLEFGALPGVPAELRGIVGDAAHGGSGPVPGAILLDPAFTAAALQKALGEGFKTVHVATHFRLRPGDDANSFLVLGDGSRLPVLDWKVKMDLKDVQLLTLSACETGLSGDKAQAATGAEVGSLGEIAQRLGAASVVSSLWPVADASTAQLMREFYRQWRGHPEAGKGAALRRAQWMLLTGGQMPTPDGAPPGASRAVGLALLDGDAPALPPFTPPPGTPYAHPYYWAPFVLIGNWR